MIIPRSHIELPKELLMEELTEILDLEEKLCKEYNAMRLSCIYGYAQATVRHYHIHFISFGITE